MQRRKFLKSLAVAVTLGAFWPLRGAWANREDIMPVKLSKEEWQQRLTPQQYNILREAGTERAFTSPLNDEKRKGVFACAGCGLELFTSDKKFNSGTGWPSFYDGIPGHLETKKDFLLVLPRTEYHCAQCGGHHGHLFEDGPKPTGLRYCSNGAVLKFIPTEEG